MCSCRIIPIRLRTSDGHDDEGDDGDGGDGGGQSPTNGACGNPGQPSCPAQPQTTCTKGGCTIHVDVTAKAPQNGNSNVSSWGQFASWVSFGAVPLLPARLLRAAWQRFYGRAWPTDPVTGKNYDAHHIQPRADNGTNDPENIKPMPHDEHMELHKANGDFARWGAWATDENIAQGGGDVIEEPAMLPEEAPFDLDIPF